MHVIHEKYNTSTETHTQMIPYHEKSCTHKLKNYHTYQWLDNTAKLSILIVSSFKVMIKFKVSKSLMSS